MRIPVALFLTITVITAYAQSPGAIPVTLDNFVRAETDPYFRHELRHHDAR